MLKLQTLVVSKLHKYLLKDIIKLTILQTLIFFRKLVTSNMVALIW